MKAQLAAVAALALLAGCGGSATHPTVSPSRTRSVAHSSQTAAPGPFKIVSLYCGKFTHAQQNTFGTDAAGGYIFKYINESNSVDGSPNLEVRFVNGSAVTADNVNGSGNPTSPGQSAEDDVEAVAGAGQNVSFTRCEPLDYGVVTVNGGGQPGTFPAGVASMGAVG